MDGALAFLFFCGLVTLGVVVVAIHTQSIRQLNADYARLARRFGGRCFAAQLFQRPSVRFRYKGFPVLVDIHSTGGEDGARYTQLHINWPDRTIRLEVYPEKFISQLGKLLGMEDIQIGSPQFDERYIIVGNDLPTIRHLLNANVQRSIDQLRRFMANDDVNVSIRGGRLLVKKRGFIREYSLLERFTQLSLELFDQVMLISTEGIEFSEDDVEAQWEAAVCQICGEEITQNAVFCTRCRTPHHLDCWQYYGACSTYGCGGKRYLVAGDSLARPRGRSTEG